MHLYPSHPHPHVLPQICAVVASTLQSQRDLPRWESRLSGERQRDLCQFCGCMQFPQHLFPPERPQPDPLPSPPCVDRMVGKGPKRPEPPASATGRGGSVIPAQPLRRALLDSMQTAAEGASSSAGRGRGRTKKAARGGCGSGRCRKAATPSSPPPSADSPDHVDPSWTPVHDPPVADPSPHHTRVADPSPHVSPVLESSSQKTPGPESSSQKTPIPESSSHETPEASGEMVAGVLCETVADMVFHRFWTFYRVSEGEQEAASMVVETECKRLLQNLRHEARVQAVRDYYASKGIRRAKKKCRDKFLSKEKYMQVPSRWCVDKMDCWEALVDAWCSPEWLVEHQRAKDKRDQIEGVPHHQGSSNLFEYEDNWVCGLVHDSCNFILHASIYPFQNDLICLVS
ncbi:uncharacterized protein [Aegilops tauschii subsp. strangulata]|uniref:uncharacterized protein n=1 Tax=Aegilops tauschii subsp. strangulata TaxID=200361 RepID=UPI00098B5BA9|nr:uncharacterized protein LOC109749406 [Aegilops tauschii subsp. strangulata]